MNTINNTDRIPRVRIGWVVRHGIIGGIIAGIVFAVGAMLISVALGSGLLDPLRLIGAAVLGEQALQPSYPLLTAVLAGILIHLILSMIFGVVFFYLLALTRQLNATTLGYLIYGMIYGLALWSFNFLLIASVAFPFFNTAYPLWPVFFVHTVVYGVVIGAYAAAISSRRIETRSAIPVSGKEKEEEQ
jgi:hypothetical protein